MYFTTGPAGNGRAAIKAITPPSISRSAPDITALSRPIKVAAKVAGAPTTTLSATTSPPSTAAGQNTRTEPTEGVIQVL